MAVPILWSKSRGESVLIDRFLPVFDVTQVCDLIVNAPPTVTYAAIRETDLRDPVVDTLFALRELPMRAARRLRRERLPPPRARITFDTIGNEGPGWAWLGETPGREFVVGSVGRFWRKDYGGHRITAREFVPFSEPGFAKLAMGFSVEPDGPGGTLLRYEARTATTDESARRAFRRYWRLIHPGVALVMRRALRRIKLEAERRAELAAPKPRVSP
jgi:hypothetical protein